LDEDQDMALDFKELVHGLSKLCRGNTREKLKFCFEVFDTNADGFVTRAELSKILSSIYNMLENNNSNYDSSDEILFFVDMLFKSGDKDHDNLLSFKEFQEVALLQPLIIKCFNLDGIEHQFSKIKLVENSK